MAWTDLKAAVAAVIKTNGNQEITGALLQSTLNSIIDQVGANASYKGVAIPSTAPGSPDGPVFYIASTQGTYANFGGFVLDGGFAILSNGSGTWSGTKFLKIEMDAKAAHGYASNPKTLKQVDDEVIQLAGEVYIKLVNLITNGNFVNGTTGWRFGANITETNVADSVLSFIGGGSLGSFGNWVRRTNETIYPQGHVLYNIVTARSLMGTRFYVGIGYSISTYDLTDQWETYSHLGYHAYNYPNYGAGLGDTVEMTNAMCFDLTEIFGAGNEPTKEEMDELLAIVSTTYFEGEYALPISELNKWLSSRFPQKQLVTKELEKIDNILDLKFTNLISNGSFENGKTGWTSAGVPGTGSSGSTIVEEPHLSGSHSLKIENIEGTRRETQTISTIPGHKYYIRGSVYIESFLSGEVRCVGIRPDQSILNEWQTISHVFEATSTETEAETRVGSYGAPSTFTAYFDEIICLDLTAVFGAGNELTQEEMDELFTEVDASPANEISTNDISVSQKEMFRYFKKNIKPLSSIEYGIMPLVTIANDDGRATDYELYKMMQRYGMRGTTFAIGTYVMSNSVNYLNGEQVKEMADAGWEIACHSYEHKNFTLETFPDGVIYQILENKKYLESLTGKKVETLAHPFGGTSAEIRNLIRSFYEGARTSVQGYNNFGDVANVYNLKTMWTDTSYTTMERIKSNIDDLLIGKPRHLMLSGHELASESGGDALTLSEMEEVCDYLKTYQMQGKLEVVTFAEAVRRIKSHPNYALL